jgi:pre-mRNA-splicing factor RBM22/SLT11
VILCLSFSLSAGLPVEVRDRVLAEAAAKAPGGGQSLALAHSASAPTSDVNRQYAINQAEQAMQAGAVIPYTGAAGVAPEAHEALMRLGRNQAYYQRNAPKLCSFFARGECSRGLECPYRHEMPRSKDDPLAKQNYRDRYYGHEDPVAAKLLVRMAEKSERSIESMPENDDQAAVTVWVGGITEGSVKEDQLR